MLGLNKAKEEPKVKKTDNKQNNKAAKSSQADEAKAVLAQMEAKKEANPDSCMFC